MYFITFLGSNKAVLQLFEYQNSLLSTIFNLYNFWKEDNFGIQKVMKTLILRLKL
jgi:hypothetical protein